MLHYLIQVLWVESKSSLLCAVLQALGTEVEHVMVQACLWVAFCISVIILIYYAWCTFKGHCGWEVREGP